MGFKTKVILINKKNKSFSYIFPKIIYYINNVI